MDLSVIIVNYNVKHFIEHCLYSVINGLKNIEHEIIVVDNNSNDGSQSLIRKEFPEIKLIINKKNLGFAKANNQALKIARGRYVLLLNPDTVVQENTLGHCIKFMDDNPEAGACGVKMIDGKGRFLPESRRAVPKPSTALYRILKLNNLFPRSGIFNRYYLGHLPVDKVSEIEVLTGAFFFIRKKVLMETSFLDESFFMYGEDIDLSYRIIKAGYKIFYLPEPSIIHYKGESTKKGTLNYVIHFYRAMMIFNNKHFAGNKVRVLTAAINIAIFLNATLSFTRTILKKLLLPFIDTSLSYFFFTLAISGWASRTFYASYSYPDLFTKVIAPLYILTWIGSIAAFKAYKRPFRFLSLVKGILAGTICILVAYALLPAELRFSRALILIGALLVLALTSTIRIILGISGSAKVQGINSGDRKVAIISNKQEYDKITQIIQKSRMRYNLVGRISPMQEDEGGEVLGKLADIKEIIRVNRIDELIFSPLDLTAGEIIEIMQLLSSSPVRKKIARTGSDYFIGSDSKIRKGEICTIKIGKIV